jgi:ABC-type uncharacterized transport system fused permease/ATPase subunit
MACLLYLMSTKGGNKMRNHGIVIVITLFALSCFNCNRQNDKGNSQNDKETRAAKIAAQNIYSMLKTDYSSLRNLVPVKASDYIGRDRHFYDSLETIFKKHGFKYIADIEDKTSAKIMTQLHTFERVMLSSVSAIVASFVDVTPDDTLKKPEDVRFKAYTIESELNDSVFIITTPNRPSILVSAPDKIATVFIPREISVDSALTLHREYIANYLKNKSNSKLIPLSNINDIIASQNRQQQLRNNFRRQLGFSLTDEEFAIFLHSCPKPFADKIREECALLSKNKQ